MGEHSIIPAATLLLVRDAVAGLEVFMLKRNHAIDFVPGAMVFPGGKVDPADSDPTLADACRSAESLPREALCLRIAAIRESFEECGILLARARGSEQLVDEARARAVDAKHRDALCHGDTDLATIVAEEELELAGDLPVYFAHWITPDVMPRRFDTHFFLVETPAGQSAVHDGGESVDSVWITPREAIAEEAADRLNIIFPTLMQLEKLSHYESVADAIAATRAEPVVTVLPRIESGENGPTLHIPIEAGYGMSEAPVEAFFKKFPGKPA
jgi:8-oxo-dGTP pyrophosphatase MutT (NUDIX family)